MADTTERNWHRGFVWSLAQDASWLVCARASCWSLGSSGWTQGEDGLTTQTQTQGPGIWLRLRLGVCANELVSA